MPKKFTFEEVKKEFEKRGYELLETEYKNSATKMRFKCPKHPNEEMSIKLNHLRRGVSCRCCANEERIKKMTIDFKVVDKAFSDAGYILLESEYKHHADLLRYRCLNHPEKELYIRYGDLKKGVRCPYCRNVGKPNIEDIKQEFKDRGYTLLTKSYRNLKMKMRYICPKHGEQKVSYVDFKHSGAGCYWCGLDKHKGENNANWKGGMRELNKYLRGMMYEWRNEQLLKAEFRCDITKTNKKLEVHHVKPYHIMRDEVLKELNLDYRNKRNKYNQEELDSIVEKLKEKHNETESVVLTRPIHREFHKLYGYEATYEDYLEFKRMKLEELNNGLR